MSKHYPQLREIIEDLTNEIDGIKRIEKSLRKANPDFKQVSEQEWRKREARCWIHGATNTSETIALEQWLTAHLSRSKTAQSKALDHYSKWAEFLLEEGIYVDFSEKDLPRPAKEESLLNYMHRHAQLVENKGWGSKNSKLALKSFVAFLKKCNSKKEIAFIEQIFPQKMDLLDGSIIRKIYPQVYPASEEILASIMKALAHQCAYGRLNARHNAAEALALSWLCLTAAQLRLPISLEKDIHKTKSSAILLNGEFPELLVLTHFGNQKVRISQRVAKFLCAVAHMPSPLLRKTILQSPIHDLRRALNTAIAAVNPNPDLGKITFLTFLSAPHHAEENIR